MSLNRRLWIDTDTASDDAVAIVMALRHPNTEVVGMSVVIGNVPVEMGVQNALYTAELCGKSIPVHAGAALPLVRPFATAQHVHGVDGMGDIGLPLKGRTATSNNAVEAMIEAFRKEPGELELVALGPVTNLALAIRIEPKFASWVKRCVIMGGTGVLPGNATPLSEFNWWIDPEAVHIVLESSMKVEMVGWDVSLADSVIDTDLAEELRNLGPLGQFSIDIQKSLRRFIQEVTGRTGFDWPDPIAMAVALEPDIASSEAHLRVEVSLGLGHERGQTIVDHLGNTKREPNCRVVYRVDRERFIDMTRKAFRA
ncbi:MAG: nucleoside hydrolase [Chloroflexi bacterium]|nr:nucleoside hydrolase [Chloroflexota bacterium]